MTPIPPAYYTLSEYRTGDFVTEADGGPPVGYVYDNFAGVCYVLWFGNPEIDAQDFARHGDQLRRGRVAMSKRQIDRRHRKSV
jgi:hypothetical protein